MGTTTITLDWRFEALRRFSEAHLEGLKAFNSHVTESSDAAIVAWEQACEGVTDDTSAGADELAEQRDRIEDLLARGRTLGILGLYAFLENYMDLVIEQLRAGGATIPEERGGSKLDQLRRQFRRVGIDLKKQPFSWNSLNQMRVVRNCIAHADGWISEAFAKRLVALGLKVRAYTPLGPPETDIERWWGLVGETFRFIHGECSKRYLNPGAT